LLKGTCKRELEGYFHLREARGNMKEENEGERRGRENLKM
jgi:hypothetical protein